MIGKSQNAFVQGSRVAIGRFLAGGNFQMMRLKPIRQIRWQRFFSDHRVVKSRYPNEWKNQMWILGSALIWIPVVF